VGSEVSGHEQGSSTGFEIVEKRHLAEGTDRRCGVELPPFGMHFKGVDILERRAGDREVVESERTVEGVQEEPEGVEPVGVEWIGVENEAHLKGLGAGGQVGRGDREHLRRWCGRRTDPAPELVRSRVAASSRIRMRRRVERRRRDATDHRVHVGEIVVWLGVDEVVEAHRDASASTVDERLFGAHAPVVRVSLSAGPTAERGLAFVGAHPSACVAADGGVFRISREVSTEGTPEVEAGVREVGSGPALHRAVFEVPNAAGDRAPVRIGTTKVHGVGTGVA
jgi:hypothetical protein